MSTKSITLFLILLLATTVQAGKITDRPKSRFGLTFQGGYGFQNTNMITLDNGNHSTISFGGGIGGNFFFGHEFSPHFDLSASVGGYTSMLQPYVSNAKVTFNSTRFTITPAYILPIKDGSRMRIKFGAGLDLSFGNELEIEIDKLPNGHNDTWNYDSAIGYHINTIFEVNASRRWAFSGGLQFNGISYRFNPGSYTYPLDTELKSPNGSAINVVFGAYYCF